MCALWGNNTTRQIQRISHDHYRYRAAGPDCRRADSRAALIWPCRIASTQSTLLPAESGASTDSASSGSCRMVTAGFDGSCRSSSSSAFQSLANDRRYRSGSGEQQQQFKGRVARHVLARNIDAGTANRQDEFSGRLLPWCRWPFRIPCCPRDPSACSRKFVGLCHVHVDAIPNTLVLSSCRRAVP